MPSFNLLYNFFKKKLEILRDYINKNFKLNYIIWLKSFATAFILFIKKKNGFLQFYMNYRNLNVIFIKNKYFIFLVFKILNCLIKVKVFIKLNLRKVYNLIQI